MKRQGFTLIELLVVLTVLGILMGLLMPLLAIAQRAAKKSATRSVMVKVDTGLRLFRADYGPYPWQAAYADLAAGDPWTNRLYWHIGTDMTTTPLGTSEYDKVRNDADAAAKHYEDFVAITPHTFINWDWEGPTSTHWDRWSQNTLTLQLNRMSAERARLAIFSGNVDISSPVYPALWLNWTDVSYGHGTRRVKPTTPLLPVPTATKLGMAKDYLHSEIEKRYVSGEAILDGWKRPLLYVCQVVEGMTSQPMMNGGHLLFLPTIDWGLQPLGRKTLAAKDGITAVPLAVDPLYLPDLSNLRHSDRRYYAAKGLEIEFELWSAGPDGRADWMRDAAANNDNLSLLPYDKNIP